MEAVVGSQRIGAIQAMHLSPGVELVNLGKVQDVAIEGVFRVVRIREQRPNLTTGRIQVVDTVRVFHLAEEVLICEDVRS
jgi:hypothetical protein